MSAPAKPQQQRAIDTRNAILSAGEALIEEYGAFRVRAQQVADAAYVSIGTFYRYFPDVSALIAELGWVAVKAEHLARLERGAA
jgi:AcrR family transcriptional regulator